MCGIIGYIGSKPALPVILDGLRRLEYRGYDSAGIALVREGKLERQRSAGKLAHFEETLNLQSADGDYGLGHTRWATHGRPTEENAHPHVDCKNRLVVVHNGIIENYLELKRKLERDGHTFVSETDTETIAHLVESEMRKDGLAAAVQRALSALRGLFALVLISVDDPGTIVAARSGPPIVIGVGDGEYLVASDVLGVLSHTRDVVYLGDREMAVVRRDGVTFTDFEGVPRSLTPRHIAWDAEMAEKAGYKHFMQKEIFEQPDAIQETLLGRISLETGDVFPGELGISEDMLRSIDRVAIVACGTSWHAGLVGKFLFEQLARLPVDVDYGSEFRYRDPFIDSRSLTVVITQSGETADTLAALREARDRGAHAIAICNVVGSMVTREAEGTVYTHAGPEIGVASTKAFTSQLIALHLLALHLARLRGTLTSKAAQPQLEALARLPRLVEETLKLNPIIEQLAGRFYERSDFLYIGRGINYPIALEGALKLKEISYIHAEGYPAGEMKHGPIALIEENVPVVALVPHDHVFEKMTSNVAEAKARGGAIIALTDGEPNVLGQMLDRSNDHILTIPSTHPLLTPVLMVVPLQLLAYHIAVRRGCDVDQPRNLAKSVTVE